MSARGARGQVILPGALLLMGAVVVIYAMVGAVTHWGDVHAVDAATRLAAIAGARAYDPVALSGGTAGLSDDPSSGSAAEARRVFTANLRRSFGGPYPRVDTSDAAIGAALRVVVFTPTPQQPTYTDPDPTPCGRAGDRVFTYATVFVSVDLSIGLADMRRAAIAHHFHACAQAI